MRTIFITISDGEVTKNIFRTKIWEILKAKKDLRFILLAPKEKKDYYTKQFGGDNVIFEEFERLKLSALQRFFHITFRHALPVSTEVINSRYLLAESKLNILKYVWFQENYLFYHVKFLRLILQKVGQFFLPKKPLKELFDKYDPCLVFASNILAYEDMNLIKEAKKRGILTISMEKSWDTSSTKGLMRVFPDYFIVPNEFSKNDRIKFHNYTAEKIFVAGMPQYDAYFLKEGIVPREEFFSSLKLDRQKKLIFYCAIGDWLFPNEHEIVEIIGKSLSAGEISSAQILARPHPKYIGIDSKLKNSRNVILDRGATYSNSQVESWEFEKKDVHHLINCIYHCDVLITTASTMTIEACIFDKPVINIAFDGYQSKSESLSVARYYKQHHYMLVTQSGGVQIVKSRDELISAINVYLKNADIDKDGRKRIREMECVYTDGQAGERVAGFIFELCNKVNQ